MFLISPPCFNGNITSPFVGGPGSLPGTVMTDLSKDPEAKAAWEAARGHYPTFLGKVLSHHGCNLGWIGAWSIWVGVVALQDINEMSWVLGLVPFFADIGYWIHYDWFKIGSITAEMQTYIISTALYCTGVALS